MANPLNSWRLTADLPVRANFEEQLAKKRDS